jgi:ABC-type cobalamin/Fe3+-siderophores transport system ATPase subunit
MHFESRQWKYNAKPRQYPCVFLERGTPWNDYRYVTQFTAYFFAHAGAERKLGFVKILQRGKKRTELPLEFEQLDEQYCSLGQSLELYENVRDLGLPTATEILTGLRDIVFSPDLREQFSGEEAYTRSLLRASSALRSLSEAGRLFGIGGGALAPLKFTYTKLLNDFDAPHQLEIAFQTPEKWLGRIVALIGRNGTGKTALLGRLAYALSGLDEDETKGLVPVRVPISQVVAISFSAFDTFKRPRRPQIGLNHIGVNYAYCGLRDERGTVNLPWAMSMFMVSLRDLSKLGRWPLWKQLLKDSGVLDEFAAPEHVSDSPESLAAWIHEQSSGHKLVLLTLAKALAKIRHGSILLFDEPETHLHPQLLSSLMRLLHMMLHAFESHAIVATHSPIVLQELPARDIRILEREGRIPIISGYPGESFGENLTEIVNTAFRVDERSKNYFRILERLVERREKEEEVAALFGKRLNLNAQMTLHALMARRKRPEDVES